MLYFYITPFFPSDTNWRGAYCYDFVKALQAENKFEVVVFMPGTGSDYDYQGIRVHLFPTKQLPSNIFPFLFRGFNEQSFCSKVSSLGLKWQEVTICHANGINNSIYALAAKKQNPHIKTLLHHHDLASFGLNLGILRHCFLYNCLMFPRFRSLHEKIDLHIFISELSRRSFLSVPEVSWSVYDNYKRQYLGLGAFRKPRIKDSYVLYNGLNATFTPSEHRNKKQIFTIGCIANFMQLKDHVTLLRALVRISAELDNWKLRLIGSGPTKSACQEFVHTNKLEKNVSFESEVDHTELPLFYQSLDLFVLPSYFEGFGCVFTEAYACGVPFITTTHCGAAELLDEPEKWTIQPRDDKKLAELILNFYRSRPKQIISKSYTFRELLPQFLRGLEAVSTDNTKH